MNTPEKNRNILLLYQIPMGGIIVDHRSSLILKTHYVVDGIETTHEVKLPLVGEDVRVVEFEVIREFEGGEVAS